MSDQNSDEDRKSGYIKEELLHPTLGRPPPAARQNQNDDDESNLFMSEPSVSELESSSENRRRLQSPAHDSPDFEYGYREQVNFAGGGLNHQQQRLLHLGNATISPGNTSLSSWDSPQLNSRQIQVSFYHDHPDVPNLQMPRPDAPNVQTNRGTASPYLNSDNEVNRSSNSTSSASTGQRERARKFVSDLRRSSQGQVQESSNTGNADDSLESSWGEGGPSTSTPSERFAQVVRPPSTRSVPNGRPDAGNSTTQQNPDDTVDMSLSISEDEDGDLRSFLDEASQNQISADDEHTADERPKRIKGTRQKEPGHRRQRSGDEAAATMMTGSKDWKGMEQDKIPFPDQDDDDDDEAETLRKLPDERRRPRANIDAQQSYRTKESANGTSLRHKSQQVSQAKGHVPRPKTHAQQTIDLKTSPQNLTQSPHMALSPKSAFIHQVQSQWSDSARKLQTLSPEYSEGSQSSFVYNPQSPAIIEGSSPQIGLPVTSHNSLSTIGSDFSWLTKQNPQPAAGMNQSYGVQEYPKDDRIKPETEERNSDLEDASVDVEARGLSEDGAGISMKGPTQSSWKYKSNPRKRVTPLSSTVQDDDAIHHYFVCPKCKTRQREFFTSLTAPRQFESASGYIAFYFGIYVMAALYIFGLQEGWPALDCIYFAVITLTTAGLGDLVPTSDGAKISCSIFIYFGVACIGLLLGSYIAGMLDESSRREAQANRIKSCPNCARMEAIRDSTSRQQSFHTSMRMGTLHRNGSSNPTVRPQQRTTAPNHTLGVVKESSSSEVVTNVSVSATEAGATQPLGTFPSPQQLYGSPVGSFHTPPQDPQNLNRYSPYEQPSPSPRNMLLRQTHTRHSSMDVGGAFTDGRASFVPRKYSADFPAAADDTRNMIYAMNTMPGQTPAPSSAPRSQSMQYEEEQDSFVPEDESMDSSSSDSSDGIETEYSEVKNAKFVFLTLKEALMNSMVIIAFGCLGFYFIEGFSIVDSWYFTTVLLTTVGYGDIVPVTKGGKLFATIYILVAGTILLNNMSLISMIPLELRKRRIESAVLNQFGDSLDDDALRELATGPLVQRLHLATQGTTGLEECTREMFSLAMLVRLGKVTEDDIKQTFAAFRKLDVHDEGVLNSKTIIGGLIRKHSTLHLNRLGSGQERAAPAVHAPPTATPMAGYFLGGSRSSAYPAAPVVSTPTHEYETAVHGIADEMSEQSPLVNHASSNIFYSSRNSVSSH